MGKPDRSDPGYAASLTSSLRWDAARDEPYLQLPSFPDLRLVPYRPGIAGDLVTLFNHHAVGRRLFVLPYPMDLAFATTMEADTLAAQAQAIAALRDTPLPRGGKAEAASAVWPFKALWSEREGRVVGDVLIWPNTAEPLWDGARQAEQERREAVKREGVKDGEGKVEEGGEKEKEGEKGGKKEGEKTGLTADDVRALPPAQQSWMLGYALEPALYGRGVMSEVLGCILEGWVRPVMRIGEVAAFIEVDNPGSEAVARRNGFVWRREERTQWPEEKGGAVHVNGYYTVDLR